MSPSTPSEHRVHWSDLLAGAAGLAAAAAGIQQENTYLTLFGFLALCTALGALRDFPWTSRAYLLLGLTLLLYTSWRFHVRGLFWKGGLAALGSILFVSAALIHVRRQRPTRAHRRPVPPAENVVSTTGAWAEIDAALGGSVVPVASDDPEMVQAVAEARRRWSEFVEAFAARHPEQHFSVKAPLTREQQTEHIWIEVSMLTSEFARGRLANTPVNLPGLKLGDPVSVTVHSIEDWIYVLSHEPVGGFTIPAVAHAANRARRPQRA